MTASSQLKIRALLVIFAGLVVSPKIQAEQRSIRDAVVKTHSYRCALPETDYRGTGLLFRQGSDVYVLTSEHVVLWGRNDYCHSSVGQTGQKLTLDLVAADWAEGLALLKVKATENLPANLPTLAQFAEGVSDQDQTTTIGFPWTEHTLYANKDGQVLAKSSQRFFLANTNAAIELIHAHGEFGMSGGPVLDHTEHKIVGMLSHQYLKMNEGGLTSVSEYSGDSPSTGENLLLVIPASTIKNWLTRYFANPGQFTAGFVKKAVDQSNGVRTVYASGLTFTATKATDGPCATQSAKDKSPNYTIKGDPVGIGGDVQVFGDAIKISVEVDRDAASHLLPTEWYLPSRNLWVQTVRDILFRPATIELTGLTYRNPETTAVSRVCVRSLEEFFRKLSSPHTSPISVITSSIGHAPLQQSLAFMRGKGSELESVIFHYKTLGLSRPTGQWLDKIQLDADAVADLMQWEMVPVDKFMSYGSFELNRPFWVELDEGDNARSIELRRILIAMDHRLKQMRL